MDTQYPAEHAATLTAEPTNGHANGHASASSADAPLRLLSKSEFLTPKARRYKTLDLRPFGYDGGIKIQSLKNFERENLEKSMQQMTKKGRQIVNMDLYREKLIKLACVEPQLSDEDIENMTQHDSAVMVYITDQINELNEISDDDIAAMRGFSKRDRTNTSASGSR